MLSDDVRTISLGVLGLSLYLANKPAPYSRTVDESSVIISRSTWRSPKTQSTAPPNHPAQAARNG